MMPQRLQVKTADVLALSVAVPAGHRHLRAVLELVDGTAIELQEATLAALARAYVAIKTDPLRRQVRLVGRQLAEGEGKPGFADWQLLETD